MDLDSHAARVLGVDAMDVDASTSSPHPMDPQFRLPAMGPEHQGTQSKAPPLPPPTRASASAWISPVSAIPEDAYGFGRVPLDSEYASSSEESTSPNPDDMVVEAWERETCVCREPRTPLLHIIPRENQLRCLGCLRPFYRAVTSAMGNGSDDAAPNPLPKATVAQQSPPPLLKHAAASQSQVAKALPPQWHVPKALPPSMPWVGGLLAAGRHLLRQSSVERCPGLSPDSGLSLCPVRRVTTYDARYGYHHLDLRLALPPMALLSVVPAAVVTPEADRYFFIAGGRRHNMWTDSRELQGLKLPAERHAIGYAASELWSNIGAATTQPETEPRLLARADSVATTAIDPPSGSDSDSLAKTVDLAAPRGDTCGNDLGVEAATLTAAAFPLLVLTADGSGGRCQIQGCGCGWDAVPYMYPGCECWGCQTQAAMAAGQAWQDSHDEMGNPVGAGPSGSAEIEEADSDDIGRPGKQRRHCCTSGQLPLAHQHS